MLPQRAYKQKIIGGNLLKNIYSKTKNVVLNMLNKIPDTIKSEIKNRLTNRVNTVFLIDQEVI